MQISARRYDTGEAVDLAVEGHAIARIESLADASGNDLPWIAPAFVDLQVNGFGGQEFADPKLMIEHVEQISLALDSHGCSGYCPTVTTQSFEILRHGLETIHQACETNTAVAHRVIGIHVEGPYISSEDGPRGAHPREHCRPPVWDEFRRLQDAAGGRIKILTLSPEYDGSAAFIEKVASSGVVVAIGHTAATGPQIKAAVDAGARLSTHLGNGAHGQIRRHPNYIWDQLAEDRLLASLIVDGHHLPREVVQSFVRAKTPQRCLLVSDITGMAGMPPGEYRGTSLGDVDILEDGRLVVGGQTQYLAGASLPISVGVANVMRFAGVDLPAAVEMASLRPLQLLGLPANELKVGATANLVLFQCDDGEACEIRILTTINHGEANDFGSQ